MFSLGKDTLHSNFLCYFSVYVSKYRQQKTVSNALLWLIASGDLSRTCLLPLFLGSGQSRATRWGACGGERITSLQLEAKGEEGEGAGDLNMPFRESHQ